MATEKTNTNEAIAEAVAEATRVANTDQGCCWSRKNTDCGTQARWTHHEVTDIQLQLHRHVCFSEELQIGGKIC